MFECAINMDRGVSICETPIKTPEAYRHRKFGNVRRKLDFGDVIDPSQHACMVGMDAHKEFIEEQAKDLEQKYNFDFLHGEPVTGGKYEWEAIEANSPESSNVPDFYFRPPYRKKPVARRFSDMLVIPGAEDNSQIRSHVSGIPIVPDACSTRNNGKSHHQSSSMVPTTKTTPSTVTRRLFSESENADGVCRINSKGNASFIAKSCANVPSTGEDWNCCGGSDLAGDLSVFTDSISDTIESSPPRLNIDSDHCHIFSKSQKSLLDSSTTLSQKESLLHSSTLSQKESLLHSSTLSQKESLLHSSTLSQKDAEKTNSSSMSLHIEQLQIETASSEVAGNSSIMLCDHGYSSNCNDNCKGSESKVENSMDTQETPDINLVDGCKRKQALVTDYYPQKKKCIDKVKRKLYEDYDD